MKLLYIDSTKSIQSLRPEIKAIYFKYLPQMGVILNYIIGNTENQLFINLDDELKVKKNILTGYFRNIKAVKKNDIVVIRNDLKKGILFLFLSRLFKKKCIYLYAFPSYDLALFIVTARSKNLVNHIKTVTIKFRKHLWLKIIRYFDLVVTCGDHALRDLTKKGINKEILYSIPMGHDFNEIISDNYAELKSRFNLVEDDYIIYYGAMDEGRKLEFILDAIKLTHSKIPVLFVGGIQEEITKLIMYAKKQNIIHLVKFTGYLPVSEALLFLSKAMLSISFIPPIDAYLYSSPTKVVESLGVGTPVIVNSEILDQHYVISDSRGGISIPYSIDGLAKQILLLCEDKQKLRIYSENGKKYILKNRNYKYLTELYFNKLNIIQR